MRVCAAAVESFQAKIETLGEAENGNLPQLMTWIPESAS